VLGRPDTCAGLFPRDCRGPPDGHTLCGRLRVSVHRTRLGVPGSVSPWEVPSGIARRTALALLGSSALAGFVRPGCAEGKIVTVGINLPLTGASAEDATTILHGAVLAIEEANARVSVAHDLSGNGFPARRLGGCA
jgi:hypothetical protein